MPVWVSATGHLWWVTAMKQGEKELERDFQFTPGVDCRYNDNFFALLDRKLAKQVKKKLGTDSNTLEGFKGTLELPGILLPSESGDESQDWKSVLHPDVDAYVINPELLPKPEEGEE